VTCFMDLVKIQGVHCHIKYTSVINLCFVVRMERVFVFASFSFYFCIYTGIGIISG